jgi:hypothetical protein
MAPNPPSYQEKNKNKNLWSSAITRHINQFDKEQLIEHISKQESTFQIITDRGIHDNRGTFGMVVLDGENVKAENKRHRYSVEFHQTSY